MCFPQVLVGFCNGMSIVEVAGPFHEINLFRDPVGEQPEYFVLADNHVLQVLTVLLCAFSDFVKQLGK